MKPQARQNVTLEPGLAARLEPVCDRYESQWLAGATPRPENFLSQVEELDRPALLRELLALDFDYRAQRGERPTAQEYCLRIPAYNSVIEEAFALSATGPKTPKPHMTPLEGLGLADNGGAVFPSPQLADFDILEELGRGGMGVVYRALDRRRGTTVALKTMQGMDPRLLYRFKQEFRALAGFSHPNLIKLYELFAEGSVWFFTMELVEGTDFLTYLRADANPGLPFSEERLRSALRLHVASVLHRDIKPGNVRVSDQGRVVLLDFGLAAELDTKGVHESTEQHLLGTIAYMSPEQGAALPLSPASDWYSVGVMLYEALTGRLPFGGSAFQIISEKGQKPQPPAELTPGLPEDLAALCADLLRRDPSQRPRYEDILQRLRSETPPSPALTTSALPQNAGFSLVGRQRHLEELWAAYQVVRQRRTVVLYLVGRSGVGKSALVRQFLGELSSQDNPLVLSGQCYEQESVPFKAFDALIDGLARHLGHLPRAEVEAVLPRDVLALTRLFPVLSRVEAVAAAVRAADIPDPLELRRRAFTAVRELLGRLGDRRPLVLHVDDLQWGDADSASLLAELLRPPDAPHFLFLGCYREEDSGKIPFLEAMERLARTTEGGEQRELHVGPLTEQEVVDIVLEFVGSDNAEPRTCAQAIAQESGGNPFFVHELTRRFTPGIEAKFPAAGALSLDELLWQRIQVLPGVVQKLLNVLAVAGQPLPEAEACAAAELDQDQLSALALLRSHALVRCAASFGSPWWTTYHDRVRETVVSRLGTEALQQLHLRLAETLERSQRVDPEVLALHYQGAGQLEEAGHYYALAADRAAEGLAFDLAARLYRVSLATRPVTGCEERTLRTRLADALSNAGRGADAAEEYLLVARGCQGMEQEELQRRAATQYLTCGYVDKGVAVAQPLLRSMGIGWPSTPRRALFGLLFQRAKLWLRGLWPCLKASADIPSIDLHRVDTTWSIALGLSAIDPILGAYFQAKGLQLALRSGDAYRVARALALEAMHVGTAGAPAKERAAILLQSAEKLARESGNVHAYGGIIPLMGGIVAYLQGRWRESAELCVYSSKTLQQICVNVHWEINTANVFCLYSNLWLGDLAKIRELCPDILRQAHDRNDLYAISSIESFIEPVIRMANDEAMIGDVGLKDVAKTLWKKGIHVQHGNVLFRQAELSLYQGMPFLAHRYAKAHQDAHNNSLTKRIQHLRCCGNELCARSCVSVAFEGVEKAQHIREAEKNTRRLKAEKRPDAIAYSNLILAGVANCYGNEERAVELLKSAHAGFQAVEMALHAAAARRRLGQLLGGDEGRALVASADAWMTNQQIRNPSRMVAVLAPGFRD